MPVDFTKLPKPSKAQSGAQGRKKRAARDREIVKQAAREHGIPIAEPDSADGSDEFTQLGPPPLDDPDTALLWVRKFQLVALHVAATKPLSDQLRERLRFVKDLGATLGMTQNRSELEQRVKGLESLLDSAAPTAAVNVQPVTPDATRPPTARGGRRAPRSLPSDTK